MNGVNGKSNHPAPVWPSFTIRRQQAKTKAVTSVRMALPTDLI